MPLYQLRCRDCGWGMHDTHYVPIGTVVDVPCQNCGGRIVRVCSTFSFRHSGLFEDPIYNPAVGQRVKSAQHYKDELRRAADRQSELTGIDHIYEPIDITEPEACGVSDPDRQGATKEHRANYEDIKAKDEADRAAKTEPLWQEREPA